MKYKWLKMIGKVLIAVICVNVITLLSCIVGSVIYQNVHITSFSEMLSATMDSDAGYVLCILLSAALVYLFYKSILRKEKITWETLGFSKERRMPQFAAGFLWGIAFVAVYILVLIAMKQVSFSFNEWNLQTCYTLLMGLVIFFGVAFAEEITFRGYIQHLLSTPHEYPGLFITAIVFSFSHLLNAGYTLLSLVYLMLGGILLGLMRIKTKNIWFPLGFHTAWNWMEIRVFGLQNDTEHHWFSTVITQNTVWNGGESGTGLILLFAELGLIIFFACVYKIKTPVSAATEC